MEIALLRRSICRRSEWRRPSPASIAVACFALLAIVAPALPWAEGPVNSYRGVHYAEGFWASVVGFQLVLLVLLRGANAIARRSYLVLGAILGAATLAAPSWFWLTTIGTDDPYMNGIMAIHEPGSLVLTPAYGWYLAMLAGAGALASLLWEFRETTHRAPGGGRPLTSPATRATPPDLTTNNP